MTAMNFWIIFLAQQNNEDSLRVSHLSEVHNTSLLKLEAKNSMINLENLENEAGSSSEKLQDITNKMQRSGYQNLHNLMNLFFKKKKKV